MDVVLLDPIRVSFLLPLVLLLCIHNIIYYMIYDIFMLKQNIQRVKTNSKIKVEINTWLHCKLK